MRFLPVVVFFAHISMADAQPAKVSRADINGDPLPPGAVARLGTLSFHPPSDVISPDPHQATFRHVFGTPATPALSPDGRTLATFHQNRDRPRIEFMDTSTGNILRGFDVVVGREVRMQFSPDGKTLAIPRRSSILYLDVLTGHVAKPIEVESLGENPITFSPDGAWVAAQPDRDDYHAPVRIWETKTGKEVAVVPGKGSSCKGLAFGPEARRLLLWSIVPTSAGKNGRAFGSETKVAVVCLDVGTGKIVGEATVGTPQHIALCQDGETVALEDADHTCVRVRHLPSGTERCIISVKEPQFAFTPDGKTLLVIDQAGRAALWDASKGARIRELEGALANRDYEIVGISKDGKTIAVLDGGWHSDASVVVWNANTGKRASRPPGHEGTVTCLAYVPGGRLLVSASIDRTVRLWKPDTGEHVRKLVDHKDAVTAVAISPDGKLVASSSQDGTIKVSAIADGKAMGDCTGPARGATALAFSSDGKTLFGGGDSSETFVLEIGAGKNPKRLSAGDNGSVMALASGGSFTLIANGGDGEEGSVPSLQVWSPVGKHPVTSIPLSEEKSRRRNGARCDAATFSADGRMIASSQISEFQGIRPSYGDALLRLWERASGQPILTLAPAVTKVLAFSPNGRLLAAGSAGRSGHLSVGYGAGIDIWDVATSKKSGALPVTPQCVAFSTDGLHLATGGRDHCITIWEAPAIQPPGKSNAPSADTQREWWSALGAHARDAHKAMAEMIEVPEHAVALLKERLRPVERSDAATVGELIRQLADGKFPERAKAAEALERLGEGAAHHIAEAMESKIGLDLHRRLEELLRKCEATSAIGLQKKRAVATLEWIGTPAARDLLRTLADGAPRAHLTVEALAALRRLQD